MRRIIHIFKVTFAAPATLHGAEFLLEAPLNQAFAHGACLKGGPASSGGKSAFSTAQDTHEFAGSAAQH
jgi:hypothetical protein